MTALSKTQALLILVTPGMVAPGRVVVDLAFGISLASRLRWMR